MQKSVSSNRGGTRPDDSHRGSGCSSSQSACSQSVVTANLLSSDPLRCSSVGETLSSSSSSFANSKCEEKDPSYKPTGLPLVFDHNPVCSANTSFCSSPPPPPQIPSCSSSCSASVCFVSPSPPSQHSASSHSLGVLPGQLHRFTRLRDFGFGQLTRHNVQQLRKLNERTLPIAYSNSFYLNASTYAKYSRFGYLGDVMVGAICCRVEDPSAALDKSHLKGAESEKEDSSIHHQNSSQCLGCHSKKPSPSSARGGGGEVERLSTVKTTTIGKRLYVLTLSVLEPYRSFGIGSELLAYILILASQDSSLVTGSGSVAGTVQHSGGSGGSAASSSGMLSSSSATSSGAVSSTELKDCYLHVWTRNTAALQFYSRFGFHVGEEVKGYYEELDPPDAFLISCRLPWSPEDMLRPERNLDCSSSSSSESSSKTEDAEKEQREQKAKGKVCVDSGGGEVTGKRLDRIETFESRAAVTGDEKRECHYLEEEGLASVGNGGSSSYSSSSSSYSSSSSSSSYSSSSSSSYSSSSSSSYSSSSSSSYSSSSSSSYSSSSSSSYSSSSSTNSGIPERSGRAICKKDSRQEGRRTSEETRKQTEALRTNWQMERRPMGDKAYDFTLHNVPPSCS